MRKPLFPQLVRLPAMGILVAATATVLAAGPAAAGTGFGPHFGGPLIDSGNWGGYAAHGSSGKFTEIVGSWTEPAAKCHGTRPLTAPWIGLDGYGTETVEQTGVAVECNGGSSPTYQGWYEMYPKAPVYFSNPVSAGDTIDASVTNTSGHTYKLVLTDETQGWTQTETKTLASAKDASAEAVIEDPTGKYPDLYDGVTFVSVSVNGEPFGDYSPTKLTSGGYKPGPLNGEGGFTIKKK
jgi:hypothetical protein